MGCWEKKSPFQMALILILLVAVPFLISMIVTYVMLGVTGSASERCDRLCCIEAYRNQQPNIAPQGPPLPHDPKYIEDKNELNDTTAVNHIGNHTVKKRLGAFLPVTLPKNEEIEDRSIGALLESLYSDDKDDWIFKCPAVVVSRGWALATGHCVKSGVSAIRIGSVCWSKSGVVRNVDEVWYSDETEDPRLALLYFEAIDGITASVGYDVWTSEKVWSFAWNRRKNENISSSQLTPDQNISCVNEMFSCFAITERKRCEDQSNGVMLNEEDNLIGFHVETICPKNGKNALVLYIDFKVYEAWIYNLVNEEEVYELDLVFQ